VVIAWGDERPTAHHGIVILGLFDGYPADGVETSGKGGGKIFRHMLNDDNAWSLFGQHLQKDFERLGAAG
jgi:hypothetical protein